MRILLVQPPSPDPITDRFFLFEPLALEYLAAGVKLDGHEVEIVDARLEPDIERVYLRMRPLVVGLTAFTNQLNIVKAIAKRLKSLSPGVVVIVGGHHATVCPEDFNEPGHIDAVVIGEGVFTLREIMRALAEGADIGQIPGIGIPGRSRMRLTARRRYTDLNLLPLPDRSLTASYRKHYFSEWFKPLASVRTSLGCTGRCNFCALWSITGGKYLRRDPAAVVQELQTIAERNIFFCDDESMLDVARMSRLADLIRESGVRKKYFLYGRVDTIVKHPDLFAKWAKIGLAQVFVGMEDFSDERLASMNKGITTSQQIKAARILDDLGIMMYASYIVDPGYGREDFVRLREYVRRLNHKYATFTVMTPLPGTRLYAAREGELLSRKPELYDMIHALLPTRLPLQQFYEELAKLWVTAVPFCRIVPTLARFGPRGMIQRLRLFGTLLRKIRLAHLDY